MACMQPPGPGAPARPERPPDLNPAHGCFPCIHGRDWQKRFCSELAIAAAGAIARRRDGCHGRLRLTASRGCQTLGTLASKSLVKQSFATRALTRIGYVRQKNAGTINSKPVKAI